MVEFGISVKEFYQLNFNEFFLYTLRVISENKKEEQKRDTQFELTRHLMALIANCNGAKVGPEDFLKLQSKEVVQEKEAITIDSMTERFTQKNKR